MSPLGAPSQLPVQEVLGDDDPMRIPPQSRYLPSHLPHASPAPGMVRSPQLRLPGPASPSPTSAPVLALPLPSYLVWSEAHSFNTECCSARPKEKESDQGGALLCCRA